MSDELPKDKIAADDIKLRTEQPNLVVDEQAAPASVPSEHTQFHNIKVARPCGVEWESMEGSDCERVCKVCNFKVFKIHSSSPDEFTKLVGPKAPDERAIYRRIDGTYMLDDCYQNRVYPNARLGWQLFRLSFIPMLGLQIVGFFLYLFRNGFPNSAAWTCVLGTTALMVGWHILGCWQIALTKRNRILSGACILVFTLPFVVSPLSTWDTALKMTLTQSKNDYPLIFTDGGTSQPPPLKATFVRKKRK